MGDTLIHYLQGKPEILTFLPGDLEHAMEDLFGEVPSLPSPYKIYLIDETVPAALGFPLAESAAVQQLEMLLDRWLDEEIAAIGDPTHHREKSRQAFDRYLAHTLRLAENALLSNLLSDYHAVFWLMHSTSLARRFSEFPRQVHQAGQPNGEAAKYRVFALWAAEMRRLVKAMATRLSPILDGEEEAALHFFYLVVDNVLILTEEFVGSDLRELRPYISHCLQQDATAIRQCFEDLQKRAANLLANDPVFRDATTRITGVEDPSSRPAMIADPRFRAFLLAHPQMQDLAGDARVETLSRILRRVSQFAVLQHLREAIIRMKVVAEDEIVSVEEPRRLFARSTRPIDFGRPGVVDPMVHRFGLMYDISAFSETLGDIARTGVKGEINSYRQMLIFQRKLEHITERHRLQFEKFLGDGAFYTSRKATRLVQAAIEIQRFYSDMRRRGFAFNKGLRIAVNYGYYRLLPTQKRPDSNERVMEFYGPGVVELSRLTTGKATKEIAELEAFLISHGYDATAVHQFFAPLARGVDVVDRSMHEREFYAYVNANGHLVNEGIVASATLIEELESELGNRSPIYRINLPFGSFLGYLAELEGVDYIGIRLIGHVALKGLAQMEVAEIVAVAPGEGEISKVEDAASLVHELRQSYAQQFEPSIPSLQDHSETKESAVQRSLMVCSTGGTADSIVMIGEFDPVSNELRRSVRLQGSDLQRLLGIELPLRHDNIELRKRSLIDLYQKMSTHQSIPVVQLDAFRERRNFSGFLLADQVEAI